MKEEDIASQYDKYKTFKQLEHALRAAQVESMELVVGFDFSKSNTWTGEITYNGRSLHGLDYQNPYMKVLDIVAPIMERFDDDNIIPAFRFGCRDSKDVDAVPLLYPQVMDPHFKGFDGLLDGYKRAVRTVKLYGPTTFTPIIRRAIEISSKYGHRKLIVCLLLTDGDVSNCELDKQSLVEASRYPICFTAVGLGDGPFDKMQEFDDDQAGRKFDNFQFVNFTSIEKQLDRFENGDLILATAIFNEVPDAMRDLKRLHIL